MIVVGIVIYNPEYDLLKKSITALFDQVDRIVLYLNSSFDKEIISGMDKVETINDGTNNGIATALNAIMEYAENLGCDWCLLMDQDSVVCSDFLRCYEKYISLKDAAIITPIISEDNNAKSNAPMDGVDLIDMCITSGSYNNIDVWKKVGGFREEFFIDYVDWEYAARVRNAGYRIYRINEVSINHKLGNKEYHSLLGHRFFTYNHNAFRKYYITRNTIVSFKLFPNEDAFSHPYLRTIKRLLITVLYEDEKKEKIKSIIKGVRDSRTLYLTIIGK